MSHASRFLGRVAGLFALIALMTIASIAREPDAPARGDVDPKTRMKFPVRVGSFEREGGIEYDAAGYPEATYLLDRIALASVFYYRDAPFPTEYANARAIVKIKTPSARLISDVPSNLHPGGRRAMFTFEGAFLGRPKVKVMSELLMFPHGDLYLTFRITYLASHADRAQQEIDAFVGRFKMP